MSNLIDQVFTLLDQPRADLQRQLDRLPPQWRLSPMEQWIKARMCEEMTQSIVFDSAGIPWGPGLPEQVWRMQDFLNRQTRAVQHYADSDGLSPRASTGER